jgi:hypothetical protein
MIEITYSTVAPTNVCINIKQSIQKVSAFVAQRLWKCGENCTTTLLTVNLLLADPQPGSGLTHGVPY